MSNEVVLLDYWASPFGMRARIALAEKGVTYEYKEQILRPVKSELLLQMNPVRKTIPVLIHNNNPVCESLIVVEYIDEVWNDNSPLLPLDPYLRAQARFWAAFIDTKVFESADRLWSTSGAEQEKAKNDFLEHLKVLDEQLGDKPYFGGDAFGFVDVALISTYSWLYTFEITGNFKVEDSCPKIKEWTKRCLLRDSVKALPDEMKIYEFFLELKKKLGIE